MKFYIRRGNEWVIEREDGKCKNFWSFGKDFPEDVQLFRYSKNWETVKHSLKEIGFKKAKEKDLRGIFEEIFWAKRFAAIEKRNEND